MGEPSKDMTDKRLRALVRKDDTSRLRSELIGCQSILKPEEIEDLNRSSLVGYVTLLQRLNNSTSSCRNKIVDFNPDDADVFEDDEKEIKKTSSVSQEVTSGGGGARSSLNLEVSEPMTQSINPFIDSSSVIRSIELLITTQVADRIERERKEQELRVEKEWIKEQAREEKRAEREEREAKKKEEREVLELKLKAEKEVLELKLKEEKEEREANDLKEKERKKERREEKRIEFEAKLKADKEAIELKLKAEKEERRIEREANEARLKIEFETLLLKNKIDSDEREKARTDREKEDRISREKREDKDKEGRNKRYQDEKDERLKKESSFEARLKLAADSLKGQVSDMPDDLAGLIDFFKHVESLFAAYAIGIDLQVSVIIPYLNTRVKRLVRNLDRGSTFENLKAAVLSEYNFSPRMYRSAFTDAFRSVGESAVQFVSRISNSLLMYLDSRDINKSYDKLVSLLISDRFRDTLDDNTRYNIADHEHDDWLGPKQMATLVDRNQSERHPNWNYLRDPKNFGCKTVTSSYRPYQKSFGFKFPFKPRN